MFAWMVGVCRFGCFVVNLFGVRWIMSFVF